MKPEDEKLLLEGKRWVWVLGGLFVVLALALFVSMSAPRYSLSGRGSANAVAHQAVTPPPIPAAHGAGQG